MGKRVQIKCIRQNGIVLLLLVMFIAIAAISYFLTVISSDDIKQYQLDSSNKALQEAKQALIAYAATYGDIDSDSDTIPDFPGEYGFLPCPDYNAGLSEGLEDNGNCGAQSISKIGYLPWRTLGLANLKDESGTCLMYAVTGDYKNDESAPPSNKVSMLNEDSNGMFQVVDQAGVVIQGQKPEDRIVAIVFAPGKPLPGQSRTIEQTGSLCGMDYANYSAYLDTYGGTDNSVLTNAAYQIDQFIHATANSIRDDNLNPYNDRFVTISREEIWQAIVARTDFSQKMSYLSEALTMCLGKYAAVSGLGRLPWPVKADLSDYQKNTSYDDNVDAAPGYAGRLPFIVNNSNSDIGVVGSAELFTVAGCNALATSGDIVDLQTPGSEYRKLWDNWKDHFFYVVSKGHSPANVAALCSANCITVDGTQRAGLVIFGGPRQPGQIRNAPVAGDTDTKFDVSNYMVNGNAGIFPDNGGNGVYSTSGIGSGEIMFCLTADASPVKTPC